LLGNDPVELLGREALLDQSESPVEVKAESAQKK
jgi:hypothetical protein